VHGCRTEKLIESERHCGAAASCSAFPGNAEQEAAALNTTARLCLSCFLLFVVVACLCLLSVCCFVFFFFLLSSFFSILFAAGPDAPGIAPQAILRGNKDTAWALMRSTDVLSTQTYNLA